MYQVIYIPRIQDEYILFQSDDLNSIYKLMNRIKTEKSKAYQYHYIWDTIKQIKIKY